MGFRASSKRCRLFMAQMDPIQLPGGSNRVGNAVKRISGNSKNPPDSCVCENIHQQVRYSFLRHDGLFSRGYAEGTHFGPARTSGMWIPSPANAHNFSATLLRQDARPILEKTKAHKLGSSAPCDSSRCFSWCCGTYRLRGGLLIRRSDRLGLLRTRLPWLRKLQAARLDDCVKDPAAGCGNGSITLRAGNRHELPSRRIVTVSLDPIWAPVCRDVPARVCTIFTKSAIPPPGGKPDGRLVAEQSSSQKSGEHANRSVQMFRAEHSTLLLFH